MNWKNSAHPYAALTVFLWSLAYPLTRLALAHFSTFSLGFLRYLIAGEAPDQATVLGGAIILTGALLFNFGERLIPALRR